MASSAGPVSPETYWKRRVFVLAGLLLVVAVVAYGCNQFTGGEEQSASSAPDSPEESSPESSVPPSPTPTDAASPDGDEENEDTGDSEDNENGDNSGDGSDGDGKAGSSSGGDNSIPAPEKASDPCRPQDVVVTAKTNKKDYAWDDKPKVTITLVNTADQTCTVDVGPENMEVRITSGDDRVFSSADCVPKSEKNDKRELSRGVPETATITWDRERSWKDCRDDDVSASSGTYVAKLHGDYTGGAKRQVFRLN